jgi:phasin family protein
MIFAIPEELSAQAKAQFDYAFKFAEATAEAAEKLFQLNVSTAKAAGVDLANQVRALTTARDVQELTSLQTTFAQSNAEKVMGYTKAVYGWATDAQSEVSSLVDTRVAEVNRSVSDAIDRAAKSAPTGSEFAFAAAKTAVSAASQAYDTLTRATKQVTAFADSTVQTAAAPVSATIDTSAAKTKRAA